MPLQVHHWLLLLLLYLYCCTPLATDTRAVFLERSTEELLVLLYGGLVEPEAEAARATPWVSRIGSIPMNGMPPPTSHPIPQTKDKRMFPACFARAAYTAVPGTWHVLPELYCCTAVLPVLGLVGFVSHGERNCENSSQVLCTAVKLYTPSFRMWKASSQPGSANLPACSWWYQAVYDTMS